MPLNLPAKIALLALIVVGAGVAGVAYVSFLDAGGLPGRQAIGVIADSVERKTAILAARSASGPRREFRP